MISQHWPAPAKLNLMLHITGRRSDGYHLLQTLFQFLDFGDELSFEITDSPEIIALFEMEDLPAEQNLIIRAARALQQQSGCNKGVKIDLIKQLPMGGGLGGGSSDAATTLVALNHLWGLHLSIDKLAEIGLNLGADLPIFIHGHSAWAEGVGEQLQSVTLPEPWFLVINPQIKVSTADIFNARELTRDCPPITIRDLISDGVLSSGLINICQSVVTERYPAIADALKWLNHFGDARLTGTGACLFASFKSQSEATNVLEQLPEQWHGFVAQGRNLSPLMQRLEKAASE
ncbi:MAG: 4-(cytidine 5'-diphospho)-2-C-methyl-D-erythritol kinase [Chromatiales bacterium]|nr:4-(cytidine 5'-diphospho)-2-C-methyl-D-erythritol kinase [Chromatiales bacterium]